MKYKLTDIIEETEHGVPFGTCELCFRTGSLTKTILILQDENDKVHHLEMGDWSWGDYIDNSYILEGVDIFELAGFISSQDIEVTDEERMMGVDDMLDLRHRIIHWIWDQGMGVMDTYSYLVNSASDISSSYLKRLTKWFKSVQEGNEDKELRAELDILVNAGEIIVKDIVKDLEE